MQALAARPGLTLVDHGAQLGLSATLAARLFQMWRTKACGVHALAVVIITFSKGDRQLNSRRKDSIESFESRPKRT